MASPDLTNGRLKVEEFMTEEANVYLPTDVHTAAVDPVTLQLIVPVAVPVYSGKCKIKDQASVSRGTPVTSEGGNQLLVVVTKIDFPIGDVPDGGFPEGSIIVCTSSMRMPQLTGAQYQMRQSVLKTFGIQYSVLADRRRQVDP